MTTELNAILRDLIDPITAKPFKCKNLVVSDRKIALDIILAYPARTRLATIRQTVSEALKPLAGDRQLEISVSSQVISHAAQRGLPLLNGVKNIIAVSSGKGGVGKSTTAANLALALSAEGARVGLLDADIYGPSQPLMMGVVNEKPESPDGKHILPIISHGIQLMSIGFLVDTDQAMVWRGPMVTQALMQLLNDTRWDALDYLVIDLPPGTGDIQLTLAQKIPVTGALIITTPQDIALLDARKGLKMFEKVGVPILGLVENMAIHICANCGHEEHVFGTGGGERMARDYALELLASMPLDIAIRSATDNGRPTVISAPDSPLARRYQEMAQRIAVKVSELAQDFSHKFPKIVIKNS